MKKQINIKRKIEKTSPFIVLTSTVALVGIGIYTRSTLITGCGAAVLWLLLFRMIYARLAHADESTQKHRSKKCGLFLFPPALLMCGLSAAQLLLSAEEKPILPLLIIPAALAVVAMLFVLFEIVANRKEHTIVAKVIRCFDTSMLGVLLTALVSRALWLGEIDEWAKMVCLTGCVLGGAIFLLGCDMLFCSICGYRNTVKSIRYLKERYYENRRTFGFISIGKNAFMVLVKTVMSIVSLSFFMFVNALFSCGIGAARFTALKMYGKDRPEQLRLYRNVSLILTLSGLCYVGYSVRFFFGGTTRQFSMAMALAIALYTFVEFGIQIREIIKLRKHYDIETESLRLVSLSSILVSFVLTQTAIMSFTEQTDHTFSNGLSGVVFGGLVVLVGVASMFRYWHYVKTYNKNSSQND